MVKWTVLRIILITIIYHPSHKFTFTRKYIIEVKILIMSKDDLC